MSDSTDVKIAKLKAVAMQEWEEELDEILESLESPIEKLFFTAFCRDQIDPCSYIEDGVPWKCVPQVECGKYRIDFVLHPATRDYPKVAVELDGHEFHEKTKEQAARDKAKDRYLQTEGYHISRFTGSQVYQDPMHVVFEVKDFWIETCRRHDLERMGGNAS